VALAWARNPNPPVLTEASADAESGRGLMPVQALSKEWGYQYPPAGGRLVYAVVGVSAEGDGNDRATLARIHKIA